MERALVGPLLSGLQLCRDCEKAGSIFKKWIPTCLLANVQDAPSWGSEEVRLAVFPMEESLMGSE